MRVRFEPAPSGELHIGNVHTAAFNWLFARHHGGTFVLRIADTDRERAKAEHVEAILRDMRWLGLDWDEGPALVSDHAVQHQEAVDRLVASGDAYRCYCTAEELVARGIERGYDGYCREAGEQDKPFTVRIRMPEGDITWRDEIRGDVTIPAAEVFDQRITRADGSPLYLLAVVVDDIDMAITHVIRGADILGATAVHVRLFEALGAPVPKFVHLGLLMGTDGRKLGKRIDSMTADAYRAQGIVPEALVNYMALLGWSSPSQEEVLTLETLIAEFDLDRANGANVVFDQTKLRWLNQQHLMKMNANELERRVLELFPDVPAETLREVVARDIIQTRVEVLSEIPDTIRYLHTPPAAQGTDRPDVVKACVDVLERLEPWGAESIKDAVFAVGEQLELNRRKTTQPLYVAISGAPSSLPLFDSMEIIGRDETLRRLRAAL